ncbi:MAG: phosphodiester glycosidase family protein [Cyanobacteria bacterium J06632_3]
MWQRPAREDIAPTPIFQGITYSRQIVAEPRPQVLHLFEIDLTTPGLRPFQTPGIGGTVPVDLPENQIRETYAQRTSRFLATHGLQLAINANFFYPFEEGSPWNYEPIEGAPVSLVGVAVSEGAAVSGPHPRYYSLCFLPQQAQVVWESTCPAETQQAVSGQPIWVSDRPLPEDMAYLATEKGLDKPYPINVAALDASGTRLWLLLSDGKQPFYSEGTTVNEAAEIVKALGAEWAVQLDGGGSTTIAVEQDGKPALLNAVIHTKIPGRERPVANHLGFFAAPLTTD